MRVHLCIVALVVVGLASAMSAKHPRPQAASAKAAHQQAAAKVEQQQKAAPAKAAAAKATAAKAAAAKAEQKSADSSEIAYFSTCPQGDDWVEYRQSCYKFFETPQYWYPAQQECRKAGGNLVSIGSRRENGFVAKLTYCRTAWSGLFAVDLTRLRDPSNYRWVDGSRSLFNGHDFSSIQHLHQPLVTVSNLSWTNNVYHARQQFVCKVPAGNSSRPCDCPVGWRSLNGNCFYMATFPATYIEADFFCRGRDADLVSLHDQQELRAISLLDLDTHECPAETWIGLIKLNPCRTDYATGRVVCYRWSDRSSDYKGFPKWMEGHPNNNETVNCVYLKDRQIATTKCYDRRRFVCKKPVGRSPSSC